LVKNSAGQSQKAELLGSQGLKRQRAALMSNSMDDLFIGYGVG